VIQLLCLFLYIIYAKTLWKKKTICFIADCMVELKSTVIVISHIENESIKKLFDEIVVL
jgi:hypothetical protein